MLSVAYRNSTDFRINEYGNALQDTPISIYIGAPDGEVILVEDAAFLLPFAAGTRNL